MCHSYIRPGNGELLCQVSEGQTIYYLLQVNMQWKWRLAETKVMELIKMLLMAAPE